ncbi:hypothetical protein [Amaricoccus macauensis]|uniref:hypothetical protein n=1 Tax=Amaricoccus macauensis TaxID=57001 RepID=UPI003C7A760F
MADKIDLPTRTLDTAAHSTLYKAAIGPSAEGVAAIRDKANTGEPKHDALIATVRNLIDRKGYPVEVPLDPDYAAEAV